MANQIATSDPTRDLRGALANRKPKHHAAILEPKAFGELLRDIAGHAARLLKLALRQLSAHVFVRPGELRRLEWAENELEGAVWRIPAPQAAFLGADTAGPLSRQVVASRQGNLLSA